MLEQPADLPWTQPDWFERSSDWIHAELGARGIVVTGTIEQPHVRPWSTVLRVPAAEGDVFFKATSPILAHEPALTAFLWGRRPNCIPEVLAAEPQHGWLLMRDSGTSLRSLLEVDSDIGHWHKILPAYAELQIELADEHTKLLTLRALDRRLAVLPAQFEQVLSDTEALRIDLPDGLTGDEYARLRALVPRFTAMCHELAAYPIPETLHHDDFHDGNIFVRDGAYIFADWAESCVAHPFFTLVVTLRSVAYRLGLDEHAHELTGLRDAYLEPWLRYDSRPNLQAACDLAGYIGMVCRALTWYHVTARLPEPYKAEHAEAVPGWLQEFINAAPELS